MRVRAIALLWLLSSCAMSPSLPTVSDDPVESFVRNEAAHILSVAREGSSPEYRFYLSDFPRDDILGMSVGNGRIYISYKLARLAMKSRWHHWLLRQTLAHEIAHDVASHSDQAASTPLNRPGVGRGLTGADIGLPWYVPFRHYSLEKELEADLKGMEYWRKLQWDCRIWVRIFAAFSKQNYTGDIYHPTDSRLHQALRVCLPASDPERIAIEARLSEANGN